MNIVDLAAERARRHPKPVAPPHPDREAFEAAFSELTEAAAGAYRNAATARAAGDSAGAALLANAAWQIMAEAESVGEQMARLG
jgi:hypothetical protein